MSGRSPREIANGLGVSEQTLRNWVFAAHVDAGERQAHQRRAGGASPPAAQGPGPRAGAGDPERSRGLVRQGDRLDPVAVFEFVGQPGRLPRRRDVPRAGRLTPAATTAGASGPPSVRALADEVLTEQTHLVHLQSRQTYGYRRIRAELVDGHGVAVGRHGPPRPGWPRRCPSSSTGSRRRPGGGGEEGAATSPTPGPRVSPQVRVRPKDLPALASNRTIAWPSPSRAPSGAVVQHALLYPPPSWGPVLRRSSRLMVEGDRLSRRAIARTLRP